MLLFRSEEQLDRWRLDRGFSDDGKMALSTMWRLAHAWYHDRLDPSWRRKTPDEAHRVLEDLGLSGDFWRFH